MNPLTSSIPQYLLDCFKRIAKSEGFTKYTIELDDTSTHGEGFIAAILRLTLVGQREERPNVVQLEKLPLVCKLLPENVKRRQYFSTVKLFEREAYFYNTILPEFIRFQQDTGLNETNGFYALPKCYAAIADSERDQFYIVMGDLKVQKFALWNKELPISVEAVRLLMVALGRLHALSFALRDQKPEVFAQFEKMEEIMLHMSKQSVNQSMFRASYNLSSNTLVAKKHLEVMRKVKAKWQQVWRQCLSSGAAGRFAVIGQGDCWNNNMLFQFEENTPKQICLLDWQVARMGSPALDLTYFLFTSTEKSLRDQHLKELLHVYYDALAETLTASGSDPKKLFTFADLEQQLKHFGAFALTMAPLLQSIMVSNGENITDMDEYADAVSRCNEENLVYFVKFDENSRLAFIERLGGVIDDAVRLGWIDCFEN